MAKVAIIEDEPMIVEMYKFKLEHGGHQVQAAYNGLDGIKLAGDFRPDLILLDLMMPEMSGDQMLQKLRETDWGKDIKVIILTNIGENDAPPILSQLGVNRYVVKAQNTPSEVAQMVNDMLNENTEQIGVV